MFRKTPSAGPAIDRRFLIAGLGAAGAMAAAPQVGRAQGTRLGLTPSGAKILLNGQPYYGMGVNFCDLFSHTVSPNNDYKLLLTHLTEQAVPFVRFNLGQYDPGPDGTAGSNGWRQYFEDKAGWYGRADAIVSAAESLNIGLIPSLFWRWETVPDLMLYNPAGNGLRDALDQWGVHNSLTRQFMRQVTTEVVSRYQGSKAIWAWEISNEIQSQWLLNPRQAPPADPSARGSPTQYFASVPPGTANGVTDIVSPQNVFPAVEEWCALVRSLDPNGRLLSGGNSVSDVAAYGHATLTSNAPDTYSMWMAQSSYASATGGVPFPIAENDPALGSISAHIYQDARTPYWWFGTPGMVTENPEGLYALYMHLSRQYGRPFFLGEFGAIVGSNNTPNKATEIAQFKSCTAQIVAQKVPLSCVWNYGYINNNAVKSGNINPAGPYSDGSRFYQLQAIGGLNAQLNA